MNISFIIPTRNTLVFTKMAYESIRKNCGVNHEIVLLDDLSTDGTLEWMDSLKDNKLIKWKNPTNKFFGHTITYDIGVRLSTNEVFSIFHSDMVTTPNYVTNLLKNLKRGCVVCAMRVEPEGIHGPGPDKILKPFGLNPSEFREDLFNKFVIEHETLEKDKTQKSFFAPWCMYKEDFLAIGGHDAKSFSPYPTEDDDISYRFHLAGFKIIMARDALVWHWISRGHRGWGKNGIGNDDSDFSYYRDRSIRNFIRKWHKYPQFDNLHYPIVPKTYDTAFIIKNCNYELLRHLEPWCSCVYIENEQLIKEYISKEQPHTSVNLSQRVKYIGNGPANDIILTFDQNEFVKDPHSFKIIMQLSDMISDSGEVGELEYGIFNIKIKSMDSHEKNLIFVKNPVIL